MALGPTGDIYDRWSLFNMFLSYLDETFGSRPHLTHVPYAFTHTSQLRTIRQNNTRLEAKGKQMADLEKDVSHNRSKGRVLSHLRITR